ARGQGEEDPVDGRTRELMGLRGLVNARPGKLTERLQDGYEGTAEPRQHVLALERALRRYDGLAAVVAIDSRNPALRIEHPHEPSPGGEPIGDFGEHVAGTVSRRQNFDGQVRGERGVSRRTRR